MFNWLTAFTKVLALIKAIQNDPALMAAIQDLLTLFPTNPATGGGGSPQMMQAAIPDKEMAALKSAFDNSTAVHAALREDMEPDHAAALNLAGLFALFTQLLPQLIALFNLFKPATA